MKNSTNFVGRSLGLFACLFRRGLPILGAALFLLFSCTSYQCPTYAMNINNQEIKFSKKGNNINKEVMWVMIGGVIGYAVVSSYKGN